jgi:hypothetical protein
MMKCIKIKSIKLWPYSSLMLENLKEAFWDAKCCKNTLLINKLHSCHIIHWRNEGGYDTTYSNWWNNSRSNDCSHGHECITYTFWKLHTIYDNSNKLPSSKKLVVKLFLEKQRREVKFGKQRNDEVLFFQTRQNRNNNHKN